MLFLEMGRLWKDLKELTGYSEGGVLSKVLFKSGTNDATLFCMAKGTEISEHTSTREGFVFVVEGKGVFNLEGKPIKMLPGVLIQLPKNAVHSLRSDEDTSFILLLCS